MISPIDITTPVQQLIDRIGSEYEHEIIPVQPAPEAKTGKSFANVQNKITKDGGNLVEGWAVWLGDFICEGEQHAVWEDNDGNLTDITPPRVALDKIMFIPDDRSTSDDKHIRHIRVNITNNPLVDHAIMLSEMKEELLRYGTQVDDDNINFNTYTGNMYNHYDTLANNVMLFLTEGGKFGSPCYCKSSKPYSQCHGKNLVEAIAVDRKNAAKVNEP